MAYLWQPSYTVWTLAGARCKPHTPGAVKASKKSSWYYARHKVNNVLVLQKRLSQKRKLAEKLLDAINTDIERGLLNLKPLGQAETTLAEHLQRYASHLRGENDTEEHVRKTVAQVDAILAGTGIRLLSELSPTPILEWLAERRQPRELPAIPPRPPERDRPGFTLAEVVNYCGCHPHTVTRLVKKFSLEASGQGKGRRYPRATVAFLQEQLGRGLGLSTCNHYIAAIRGFVNWLVEDQDSAKNPLRKLKKFNVDVDVRVNRRALMPDELSRLLAAVAANGPYRGLSGSDRAALYLTATGTGFREGELASLRPENVSEKEGLIVLKAEHAKNGREARQPVNPDVIRGLQGVLAQTSRGQPLWPGTWAERGAEMLRRDLDAAGIPYMVEGAVIDFHALRHTYITHLVASGVQPKEAQVLARHSTITLTLDYYSHTDTARLRDALARLQQSRGG